MADEKEKVTPAEGEESESGDESEEGSDEDSKESDDDSEEDKNLDKDDQEKPDWKQVAEDERKSKEKAEKALSEDRYKQSERKRKEVDIEDDEEEEEKPATVSQIEQIINKNNAAIRKETRAAQTRVIAKELTNSDDEADAVVAVYENPERVFPSHLSHEEQMQEAHSIAHGPRSKAKVEELRRSLKSKATKGESSAEDTHPDKQTKAKEPKLDTDVKKILLDQGYKLVKGRFEKKLPNGKTMYYDLDTKKPIVV